MNYIKINGPIWHDRSISIAPNKIGKYNQIVIGHSDYPEPFYMTGYDLKKYPLKEYATKAGLKQMHNIPIKKLSTDLILEEL